MKKILIVEDEKPLARALTLKLKNEGYDAEVAYNGETALEILQKNKFDLVLLDLIMPKVDGFNVLEEINRKKIKTKVVVTSNLGQNQDIERAKKLGAVDYFVKSEISIAKLVESIKEII